MEYQNQYLLDDWRSPDGLIPHLFLSLLFLGEMGRIQFELNGRQQKNQFFKGRERGSGLQLMRKGKDNKKKELNKGVSEPNKKELMSICRSTEDIDVILEYTHSLDADVRLEAVKQLCPCKVQKDIDVFWERVFEMVPDEDARIRKRILHIICDGSPERLEDRIYEALHEFNRDKDSDIRRTAHKVMATYERTGKWNIL